MQGDAHRGDDLPSVSPVNFAFYVPLPVQNYVRQQEAILLEALASISARRGDEHEASRWEAKLIGRKLKILSWLADDIRMKEVYDDLASIIDDERKWQFFVRAALEAKDDFQHARDAKNRAKNLKDKLQKSFSALIPLLDELAELAELKPGGTYNHALTWPHELLETELCRAGDPSRITIIPTRDIFDRCYRAVMEWELGAQHGQEVFALSSQKSTPRTNFVRAFWYELCWPNPREGMIDWKKKSDLFKAIAGIATVLLDQPDEVVTEDNVRKALEDL